MNRKPTSSGRVYDARLPDATNGAPDTTLEALTGFRTLSARLVALGMSGEDAEAWAKIAVQGFRNAVLRGMALPDAEASFFGPEKAATYWASHNGDFDAPKRRAKA